MYYALRPAMDIGCSSFVSYLSWLDSIKSAFPNIGDDKIGNDLAYSAMLTLCLVVYWV